MLWASIPLSSKSSGRDFSAQTGGEGCFISSVHEIKKTFVGYPVQQRHLAADGDLVPADLRHPLLGWEAHALARQNAQAPMLAHLLALSLIHI